MLSHPVVWDTLGWDSISQTVQILGTDLSPVGEIYFHRSSQLGVAHAKEIKHDHSPVVYVVLDPSYMYD